MTVPNQVTIYEDQRNQVTVYEDATTLLTVQLGLSQAQNSRHVHNQASPSTSWVITHGLGGKPSVTIVDSADTTVVGDVTYNSNTQTVSYTHLTLPTKA